MFTVIHSSPFFVFQCRRSPSPFCRMYQFFSGLNLSCSEGGDVEPSGKAELQWCPHIPAQKQELRLHQLTQTTTTCMLHQVPDEIHTGTIVTAAWKAGYTEFTEIIFILYFDKYRNNFWSWCVDTCIEYKLAQVDPLSVP